MNKKQLIKALEKFPDSTEVCIVDWRKSLYHATCDPNGEGVEYFFKVEFIHIQENAKPFIGLSFANDDYDKYGNKL